MVLKHEYSEFALIGSLWSGGKENAMKLAEAGKWHDFYSWLEDVVESEEGMSLTDVNDMLWFEFDYIKEALGIEASDDD